MNAPTDNIPLKLTSFSHGGGCGCKIAPGVLAEILKKSSGFPVPPQLLVGIETADDAAVYKLNDEQALIATTDFFMPIVDDPYDFGRIAATNAISDVYAMGGTPIMALALVGMLWLLLPRGETNLPCVVETIGYGGGRGFPTDWLVYASSGYAHLVMDTRGQGSTWRQGDTPDDALSGPSVPGFMTRGILDPETYYYRRLMTDAVRAVEAAASFGRIDPSCIAVSGGSQGGGLTLAVAGLAGMGLAPAVERRSCCFIYALPGCHECAGCPRLSART